MEATHVYVVTTINGDVECYGELSPNSNFSVVCDDEEDDGFWCNGRPYGGWFTDWEDVVECLQREYSSPIMEISAI